jgi:hypothetical protein
MDGKGGFQKPTPPADDGKHYYYTCEGGQPPQGAKVGSTFAHISSCEDAVPPSKTVGRVCCETVGDTVQVCA